MLAHHEGIEENLRFLIHEVRKQLVATRDYLQTPTLLEHEGFWDKDDYIDNLKNVILRKCFARVTRTAQEDEATVALLKAIDVVTVNLERIADFCEDIVVQTRHVEPSVLLRHDFTPFFAHILAAIDRIEEALLRSDATRALEICRAEEVADHLYAGWLQRIQQELKAGKDVESHVSILFISHYLERMGDSLLNIGEAVLSACLGERIKMEEFRVLEGFLGAEGLQHSLVDIALEPVAETRSGCRINRIRPRRSAGEGALMIFKEGRLDKLLAEKEGATRWEEILPGLVPRIHAFHHHGDNGSILFEYLPGHTFEELLLRGDSQATAEALALLCRTLESVWRRTRTEEPVAPRFVEQLRRRLKDVYALHPAFRTSRRGIGKLEVRSFDGLVEALRHLDERLQCPFSVFTHGDCNIDNIILRHGEPRVHFVDLHRSRMGDWLQDVSVFLVSNFRLQVLDGQVRRRVQEVVLRFHGFAADLAPQLGDTTFAPRLALGLARSLATSTRFVLDPGFAKDLFLRARHLLEELIVTPDERLSGFEIPGEVLFD
jgi:phosphate uptake regulator